MRLPVPHVPGWYPDNEDQSVVRYWDGSDWTPRRRPRPAWAPTSTKPLRLVSLSAPPPLPVQGRHPARRMARTRRAGWPRARLVALLAMGVALAGAVGATIVDSVGQPFGAQPPPVAILNDPGFASRASLVCEANLGPAPPAGLPAANQISSKNLEVAVARLRALPVEVADRPAVTSWLSRWDSVASLVTRVSSTRPSARTPALRAGLEDDLQRIDAFARVNSIAGCTL